MEEKWYICVTHLGHLAMKIKHLSTKHVAKLADNLLVPCIVLQTHFGLNLHNINTQSK